jgi:hypothetical protein
MESFNPDELGLFDDWEPAIWSEVNLDDEDYDEAINTITLGSSDSPSTPETQRSVRVRSSSDSPAAASKSINEIYEYNSSGNKITRAGCTKPPRGHDKFAETLPDSPDELLDVGLLNSGKGFGGLQNSNNGLNAPPLSSNLHWEFKHWHPGMELPKEYQCKGQETKKEKLSSDFEIANLP